MINLGQLKHIATADPRLYEVLKQLVTSQNKLNNYHGLDTSGVVTAPPAIGSFTIAAADGRFVGTIIDRSPVNKGIVYWVEYASTPSFQDAVAVYLGPSRAFDKLLGNGVFFFRAFSQYPLSPPSAKVLSTPTNLAGGGALAGPPLPVSQGSGTSVLPGTGYGTDPTQPSGVLRSSNRGHFF